jgi:hypothetical protein
MSPTTAAPQACEAPAQTSIQRAAQVRRLLMYRAPQRIVIDTGLKPGQWYVVRALQQPEQDLMASLGNAGASR